MSNATHRDVEVLVVGAGPAGIAAATAAADCGRQVVVLDDNPAAGGQIWRGGVPSPKSHDLPEKAQAMESFHRSGATLLPGRRVVDAPQEHLLQAVMDEGSVEKIESFSWNKLILATGARERFLPFPGWTLPGVFGAGGLQALVKSGLPVQDKRIVVAGSGPLLLAVAAHLQDYGAHVVSIAEQASHTQIASLAASLLMSPGKLLQGARYRSQLTRTLYRFNTWVIAAEGDSVLREVTLTDGRRTWTEACDYLACGFHLVPNVELPALLQCQIENGFVKVDEQQATTVEDVFCAGEPTGIAGLGAALVEGEIAGLAASNELQRAAALYSRRDRERSFGKCLDAAFAIRSELRKLPAADTIVCRCEDVPFSHLQSYNNWTEAKLQTRCGMGACQGRICGPVVNTLFGWNAGSVRPPIFPISLASFGDENTISMNPEKAFQEMPCNGPE